MSNLRAQNSTPGPVQINKIKEFKQEQSLVSFFYRKDVKWLNVIQIAAINIIGLYGCLFFPYTIRWKTYAWVWISGYIAAFGVTGGAHRYWTHKSYKANTALKVILAVCYVMAGMNKIHQWVRDHRMHHKYSETDADPHNTRRGFFFSHVGWLMLNRHPELLKKGQKIDMSDIEADPVVSFVDRHFVPLKIMFCYVIPVLIPVIFWNETWYWSIIGQFIRYFLSLNSTWSVNSFAHFYGNRAYDKNIAPADNIYVSIMVLGEGWHNYHHVFPMDYRASELGEGRYINVTTCLIDFFAKLGWAYDRNVPSDALIKKTILNRGDGTHFNISELLKNN